MVPDSVVNQMLGGFFAAVFGIAASWIMDRRRAKQARIEWHTRLQHLASRLEKDTKSETLMKKTDFEKVTDKLAYYHTAERVLDDMESHFASTPVSIPNEMWEAQDKLAEEYAHMESRPPHDEDFINAIDEMSEQAKKIEKWASKKLG